jgi:hypothetical protein
MPSFTPAQRLLISAPSWIAIGLIDCPLFDFRENLFYCKESLEDVFPVRKKPNGNRHGEENDFSYGV